MKGMLACCAALLAVLATPAFAAGKAGGLDRGFNGDGKVVTVFPSDRSAPSYPEYRLPYEFAPGRIAMAAAPGGKLVVANNKAIVEYLSDGRRSPRFGGSGAVPITLPEGAHFQLADVAVDSKGRVLVAGTTRPRPPAYGMANLSLPGPVPSTATVERFQSNGQPDPTFGGNGVVDTDLGAAHPTYKGQSYSGSAVAVVGLAVDQADRPVLTGSAVAEVGRCSTPRQNRYERSQALVARLTTGGAPDPSFAGGGTKSIGGLSWLGFPATVSSGVLSVSTSADPCKPAKPGNPSVLADLGGDGSINQGFASDGFWSRAFTRISNFAVTPSGGILLMTRKVELSRGRWIESAPSITSLRGDGSVDPRFGSGGRADPQLPRHASITAIASDPQGRALLAGTISHRPRHGGSPHLLFLLIRMTTAGKPDPTFGHNGRVATSFGHNASVLASEVLVDASGHIAVGGKLSGPHSNNTFAIARYLGGR